jgi:predicted DNA binding protein
LTSRTVPKSGVKKIHRKTDEASNRLVVCKLRVSLPRPYWHPELARKHPETSIDVLGYSLTKEGMHVDMRVRVNDITTWIDELRAFDDVHDVQPLGRMGKTVTVRATYKVDHLFAVVNRLHLILRTPVTIRDGAFDVLMAGPESNTKRFIEMFPSNVQVKSVYDSERDVDPLLTPRQSEIFHRAMNEGYFEVPRRVTLTELAERIGVAPSSLSEMLAVVEKKVLQASPTVRM